MVEEGGDMLDPSMLGGGKECKEAGGGTPEAEEVGGGSGEESGSTIGGEFESSGGALGQSVGGALPSVSGTLGKYPPPSDMVRSAVEESSGDTSGGAALW